MKDHTRDYLNLYTKAAKKLGLKYKVTDSFIYDIFYKNKKIRFYQATCSANDSVSYIITKKKNNTHIFLKKNKLPTFKQHTITDKSINEILELAKAIKYPVILKPIEGYGGEGIIANLNNATQLKNATKLIKHNYDKILIEKFYNGFDYRFVVVNKKILAVTKRFPAHIMGNGKDNIKSLINKQFKNHPYDFVIDSEVLKKLDDQALNFKSVPKKGQIIYLRHRSNIHLGGAVLNLNIKTVHPDYIKACLKIMDVFQLKFAGIDFMSTDITKSLKITKGGITEVNYNPGIYMQNRSADNPIKDIAEQVLINLFGIKGKKKNKKSK